jgi:hypothetical protein
MMSPISRSKLSRSSGLLPHEAAFDSSDILLCARVTEKDFPVSEKGLLCGSIEFGIRVGKKLVGNVTSCNKVTRRRIILVVGVKINIPARGGSIYSSSAEIDAEIGTHGW